MSDEKPRLGELLASTAKALREAPPEVRQHLGGIVNRHGAAGWAEVEVAVADPFDEWLSPSGDLICRDHKRVLTVLRPLWTAQARAEYQAGFRAGRGWEGKP